MALQLFEEGLQKIFILVLNMSLTACVVIIAVLLARLFLKKAPAVFSYALWAVVLFRLLCPVSFSLPVSLLGALQNEPAVKGRMEYITDDIGYMEKPEVAMPVPGIGEAVSESLPLANREASVNPMQVYLAVSAYLWLLGVLSMGVYSALSLRRLKKRLKNAVHERENIYRFQKKGSPFVYGLFRPRIYLPENIEAEEERYILLHEQIHIKRGDSVFRLLAYFALWLHWFNPLVWLAFILSGRDMEISCDEAVLGRLGNKVKKEYSASLLNMAAGGSIVKGIPVAFGESDTGVRVKNVLRYRKPAAYLAVAAAVVCALLTVIFLANPAKAKENTNVFYGVVAAVEGKDGAQETVVRIPRVGDVALPEAEEVSLYLERDAEDIIMVGDILRITFSPNQEISMVSADSYGQTLYHFAAVPEGKAESILVMGEGRSLIRQEDDRCLFTVPLGMAADAQAGDIVEIYHYPDADTTEQIYIFPEAGDEGHVLLTAAEVLDVDEEHYDIWVELSTEDAEVFLSEFGFGISVKLLKSGTEQWAVYAGEDGKLLTGADALLQEIMGDGFRGGAVDGEGSGFRNGASGSGSSVLGTESESNNNGAAGTGTVYADYTDVLSEDTGSELFTLIPSLLARGDLEDGLYVIYPRSISRSARGFDLYVTDEEYNELPLVPFAENCVFRVNWERDKIVYSPINFDKFADLITQSARVINPVVYCEIENNLVVRADLESGYYSYGFSYERPVDGSWEWDSYVENAEEFHHMTEAEVLQSFYALDGTESADIADSAGIEQITVYTGNIGDGESGVVFFRDADGNTLGTEWAHQARAGWNNVYIGEAEGVGFILRVHIEDRDTYGNYGYQVFRFGGNGEIRQIAGSSFTFDEFRQYDDEMFHTWADNLTYYLEHSHLVLSSQEGEIRTEHVSEADRYCYETLRRGR